MGEIGRLTFIHRLGIPKLIAISQFRLQRIDLATLCKNLLNFGPVTQEFKRGKDVHPSSISSFATTAWRRHC